jgi:hypothetical protein
MSDFEFFDTNGRPLKRKFIGRPSAWKQDALAVIAALPAGWQGIGEDINSEIARQIGHPHDSHAYGALTKRAVQLRLLEPTGKYRAMRKEQSHSRSSALYRKLP